MVINNETSENGSISMFGHELIRDILLPEILGKHTNEILYWGGKTIARKFPLVIFDEIREFFYEAGWGDLNIINEKKHEILFELSGEIIERRLSVKNEVCFKIEAGFLAEQIQIQKKVMAEAAEEIHKRTKKVRFTVRWDEEVPVHL